MTNVLAFDLSLNAPGFAFSDSPATLPSTNLKGDERCSLRVQQVLSLLDKRDPDVVVLEGYAFAASMAGARSLAEFVGVVKTIMHERHIPYALVPPSTLKKYATGSGKASKELVIASALKAGAQIPQRPKSGGGREHDDNAADAWWLWQMGIARYTPTSAHVRAMPDLNRESLTKVKWPKVKAVSQRAVRGGHE